MIASISDINSLTDLWKNNSGLYPDKDAVIHWSAGEEPFRWSCSSLYNKALLYASYIRSAGIKQGEVCAIIISHNKEFYPLYMGICLSGAIPAVLAYPNPRLHPDKFREGIVGMAQRSGLDWIITERTAGGYLEELLKEKSTTIKGLIYPLEHPLTSNDDTGFISGSNASSDDTLLLQHSSGTTGLQKPVLLTNNAVLRHLQNYAEAIKLTKNDKIVSWLPLYHDMGLIAAFHLPLALCIPLIQIDPFEWVTIPSLLPQIISSEKGTISWIPNFALNVLTDKVREEDLEGISLDSWRLIINCSEPVRYESHKKFIARYKKYGLRESALSSSYAMAETTFAITQTPPDELVREITVDPEEYSRGRIRLADEGRKFLSSGKVIKGCSIRIVNESREDLPPGYIGELAVTSESLFEGYRNYPEKSAEVLSGGWYYTGDLGFEVDGCYFISGRQKDIIIIAGINIYPEDIEAAVGEIKGVIPGRVIAAGEYDDELGSEQVTVIAETALTDDKDIMKLKEEIVWAGMSLDISIRKVHLVPPRWLIKSSAGKPARKTNIERIKRELI